jgi:hypothetical protein
VSADRYELGITRLGRRAIAEGLPEDVAAAVGFITGPLLHGPVRAVGGDGVAVEGVQVEASAAVAEPVLFPPPAGHPVDHAGGGQLIWASSTVGCSTPRTQTLGGQFDRRLVAPGAVDVASQRLVERSF